MAFLLWRGLPGWSLGLFFGDTPPFAALLDGAPVFDGLWPACLGTLALVALAASYRHPVGVASGVYLAEYASGRSTKMFSFCRICLQVSRPSSWGCSDLPDPAAAQNCGARGNTGLLLSALCLALLVLPYLISTTRLSMENLPHDLRLARRVSA